MKRLFARLLLVCVSLLVTLALAEGALRVAPLPDLRLLASFQAPPAAAWKDPGWGDPPDRAFRRHRVVGHEHAPDVDLAVPLVEASGGSFRFKTNNLGLRRDSDTPTEPEPGAFRVLVLGDSQTDGYVDNPESFANLLERDTNAERAAGISRPLEVLNAGVAGYSPAQELLWYSAHGAELQPDLVLLVFYPGNDALDLLDPGKPSVDPATGRLIRPHEEESPEAAGPLDVSRMVLLARYAVQAGPLAGLWRQLGLPGSSSGAAGYPTDTLVQVFRTCHGCFLQSLQQAARARREPGAMQAALELAANLLIRLDQEVRDNGGRLAVAILPTRAMAEPSLGGPQQRAIAALLGLDEADLRYEQRVASTVAERLQAAAVPVIQLYGPLAAGSTGGPLYYSRDWHLNAAGHQATAAALGEALREQGLLP